MALNKYNHNSARHNTWVLVKSVAGSNTELYENISPEKAPRTGLGVWGKNVKPTEGRYPYKLGSHERCVCQTETFNWHLLGGPSEGLKQNRARGVQSRTQRRIGQQWVQRGLKGESGSSGSNEDLKENRSTVGPMGT